MAKKMRLNTDKGSSSNVTPKGQSVPEDKQMEAQRIIVEDLEKQVRLREDADRKAAELAKKQSDLLDREINARARLQESEPVQEQATESPQPGSKGRGLFSRRKKDVLMSVVPPKTNSALKFYTGFRKFVRVLKVGTAIGAATLIGGVGMAALYLSKVGISFGSNGHTEFRPADKFPLDKKTGKPVIDPETKKPAGPLTYTQPDLEIPRPAVRLLELIGEHPVTHIPGPAIINGGLNQAPRVIGTKSLTINGNVNQTNVEVADNPNLPNGRLIINGNMTDGGLNAAVIQVSGAIRRKDSSAVATQKATFGSVLNGATVRINPDGLLPMKNTGIVVTRQIENAEADPLGGTLKMKDVGVGVFVDGLPITPTPNYSKAVQPGIPSVAKPAGDWRYKAPATGKIKPVGNRP